MAQGLQGADQAVLVEAIAPVGAAIIGAAGAVDLPLASLGRGALQGEEGVMVGHAGQHPGRVDALAGIEGDAEGLRGVQALKMGHVVGQGQATAGAFGHKVIPGGPGQGLPRQQAGVGVQHRLVEMVGDGAQDLGLRRAGVRQQGQGLVAVAGKEDGVEVLPSARRTVQAHPFVPALDPRHRAVQSHPVAEGGDELVHIGPGPALDHPPDGAVLDGQQAVIEEEADEEARRKAEHPLRIGGPDGGAHGQDVIVTEELTIAPGGEEVAEADFVTFFRQQLGGLAIEAQDVPQHAPEAGVDQVGALGEEAVESGAVVLQAGAAAGDAEAHVAGLTLRPHFVQQGDEVGIGPVIEDDEAGVHGVVVPAQADRVGVDVAADVVAGLKEGDCVPFTM